MTTPNPRLPDPGTGASVHQSSRRSSPSCLIESDCDAYNNTLHTKRAWQQVARIEDLCCAYCAPRKCY